MSHDIQSIAPTPSNRAAILILQSGVKTPLLCISASTTLKVFQEPFHGDAAPLKIAYHNDSRRGATQIRRRENII